MARDQVKITQLDDADVARWDAYVDGHPDATFFHRAGWRSVLKRSFGHTCYYLFAEQDNEICGILPLGRIRSWLFGDSLVSTPFCVYGGVVATDPAVRKQLTSAACELADSLQVDHLEMRNLQTGGDEWPAKDLYVRFRKEIDPDPDENMKNIPRKQRAMVRKGIKAGLQSTLDTGVDRLYAAYSESVRNLGTPVFSRRFFQELKREFADQCEILTITKDDEVVASVMSFYFRDEVLPYYGGGTAQARAVKANDFMYWELMRRSAERGVRIFDFGRSKKGTGSYSFKKNWGFEPEDLHYEFYLVKSKSIPDINPLNPKYRLMTNIWSHLPLGLSRLAGPLISRSLG